MGGGAICITPPGPSPGRCDPEADSLPKLCEFSGGIWVAQSVKWLALNLRVLSSSPALSPILEHGTYF